MSVQQRWMTIICAGLATLAMACSDDNGKKEENPGDKTPACVASCRNNVLTICDANGNAKTETCTPGCNADGMTCKKAECVPSCRNKILTTCDANGNAKMEACTPGCESDGVTCKKAECVPSCTGNVLTTCDGNTPKKENCAECDADGITCKTNTNTCTPSCRGKVVTTCDASGYAQEAPCLPGCDTDGVTCKTEVHDDNIDKDILPVPEEQKNDATEICDPTTFVDHCNANTQVYCAKNGTYGVYQVSHSDCLDDTVCVVTLETTIGGKKVNYTNCLEACEQEVNTVKVECDIDTYDSSEILVTKTCKNSSKGRVWNDRIEHCTGECSENACAEKDKPCEDEKDKCVDDNVVGCVDGVVHFTNCTRDGMVCGGDGDVLSCGSF